ncbi:MAG TPA: hypothetical protein VHR66_30290, partial [Gemmataceae bacterium]|nr:hypothetical protein [Gemmataceae bacterium]
MRMLVAALLGTALAAAPALAADPTPEELKKSIDRFEKAVKDLQELKEALKTDGVREKVATLDSKIDLIDKDIQEIKKDIRDLKRKVEGTTSTSLRPNDTATLKGQGRVRFINQYPEEMS